MKKLLLIFTLTLLLIIPLIHAQTEYVSGGVTRDASYQQDGTGVWSGRTGVTYSRTGDYQGGGIVFDVDDDTQNEIIVYDHISNELQILRQNTTGLTLEHSEPITGNVGLHDFYQTVGILDYDSDGFTEIIVYDGTNFSVYEWNTTHFTLEQTQDDNITRVGGTHDVSLFPVIRCSPSGTWIDNKNRCMVYFASDGNWHGAMIQYNLDDNIVQAKDSPQTQPDTTMYSTLVDLDSDGSNDYLTGAWQQGRYFYIYKGSIDSTGNLTTTLFATYDYGSTGKPSPESFIVNNMDGVVGNGLELTLVYGDNTNWYGITYNGKTGVTVEGSYCSIISCAEGEIKSNNLFLCDSSTYCDYSGSDVCFVAHSKTDSPSDTTTVQCFSLYAGVGFEKTFIDDPTIPTASPYIVHDVKLTGSQGFLGEQVFVGSNKQSLPSLDGGIIIPVDYQLSGSLDMIGFKSTGLTYYDDAYINRNVQIIQHTAQTGNPVCEGTPVRNTLTLSDNESNIGYCHVQEQYVNGTQKSIESNITYYLPSTELIYTADEVGSFYLNFRCRDQFNTAYSEHKYTISVSNDTTVCNLFDENPTTTILETSEELEDENLLIEQSNELMGMFGLKTRLAKTLIVLIALMIIVVSTAILMASQGVDGIAITVIEGFLIITVMSIAFYLGWMSVIPIVMLGLFFAVALAGILAKRVMVGS